MLTSRACRRILPSSSKLFTNFSTRNFDKNMKERLANQKKQEQEFTPQQQQIIENYTEEIHKQLENQSILKTFRKEVFDRSRMEQADIDITNKFAQYDRELKERLNKGTKNQQLASAHNLFKMFVNDKTIFGVKTDDPILSNYANYAAYKTAQVKTVRKPDNARTVSQSTAPRFFKYVQENLGPEYLESKVLDAQLRATGETVESYSRSLKNEIQTQGTFQRLYEIPHRSNADMDNQHVDPYEEPLDGEGAIGQPGEEAPRVSQECISQIYELYLDGWTVRDLSKRFGMLPARIKYFVWARAQFYFQILPKFGFQHVKVAAQWEDMLGRQFGYMDYGIDLQAMKDQGEQIMNRIHCWSDRMLDIQGGNDLVRYEQALKQREKKHEFNRYIKMPVGTEGKLNKMYYLYDWKIFRGKGSDHYHLTTNTFKQLFKMKGRKTYC